MRAKSILTFLTFMLLLSGWLPVALSPSPSVASSTITPPVGIVSWVPITLVNAQPQSTVAKFQQLVKVSSVDFQSREAPNLQNIEFFDTDGRLIRSWLESGNSNTAVETVYWLNMTQAIPGSSSLVVYMGFAPVNRVLFNATKGIGEAPQLSPTYGKYDDGRKVFPFYDNFAGTVLSNRTWTYYQGAGEIAVNNGLTISGNPDYTCQTGPNPLAPIVSSISNATRLTRAKVLDLRLHASTNGPNLRFGFTDSNLCPVQQGLQGRGDTVSFGAGDVPLPPGNALTYLTRIQMSATNGGSGIPPGCSVASTCQTSTATANIGYNTFSIEATDKDVRYLLNYEGIPSDTITTNVPEYNRSMNVAIQQTNYPTPSQVQWIRIRDYPPGGIMPLAVVNGEPKGFTFSVAPTLKVVPLSGNGTYRISVLPFNGTTHPVKLTVSTPTGVACRFSNESVFSQDCFAQIPLIPGTTTLYLYASLTSRTNSLYSAIVHVESPRFIDRFVRIGLIPKAVTGVGNVVSIDDLNDTSTGPCMSQTQGSCFSIQQDFFINVPGSQLQPSLFIRNIVWIRQNPSAGLSYKSQFEVFKVNDTTSFPFGSVLLACNGIVSGNLCVPSGNFVPFSVPRNFKLESQIFGSTLRISLNGVAKENYPLGVAGASIGGICSDTLGCAAPAIGNATAYLQPQLDIVGEMTSSGHPDRVAFWNSTRLSVTSALKVGSHWVRNLVQTPVPFGQASASGLSAGLGWTVDGPGRGTLSFVSSESVQGIAFIPRALSQST